MAAKTEKSYSGGFQKRYLSIFN